MRGYVPGTLLGNIIRIRHPADSVQINAIENAVYTGKVFIDGSGIVHRLLQEKVLQFLRCGAIPHHGIHHQSRHLHHIQSPEQEIIQPLRLL